MPGGDRTGPMGMGPMTGRAAGYCAGYPVPGFMNPVGGRGFGGGGGRGFGGRGGGRGWRNMYYATGLPGWARAGWWGAPAYGAPVYGGPMPMQAPTRDVERDTLKAQAEYLTNSLAEIKNRIEELESQQPQDSDK
ncbi:MAG: DUF5320 domain-containing protein [Verrucomicrobia bacterium]|nr:DUF5320 domain-containing protein [Verrucomicrobiota bacterium]